MFKATVFERLFDSLSAYVKGFYSLNRRIEFLSLEVSIASTVALNFFPWIWAMSEGEGQGVHREGSGFSFIFWALEYHTLILFFLKEPL